MTEHRRRGALRARRHRAPGREQPRPARHPRQQHVRRLLRGRRARRRAVLPRPLQPRSRRGAQGSQRHDLRPRRRRRRRQSRRRRKPAFSRCREVSLQGGMYGNKRFTTDFDQPLSEKVAFRLNGMYEDSDSFRDCRRPETLRRHADPDVRAEQPDQDHRELRIPARHARRRSRHHVVSRPAGRCRSLDLLRQPRRQPRRRRREPGFVDDRAPGRRAHHPQPHVDRQLRSRVSELRAGRGHGGPEPGDADRLQQRHDADEPVQPDRPHLRRRRPGAIRHTLLAGAEVGRQLTDNFRNTGFFNNTATSILVPYRRRRRSPRRSRSARARPTPTITSGPTWPPPTCRIRSSCRRTCSSSAVCASIGSTCSITTIARAITLGASRQSRCRRAPASSSSRSRRSRSTAATASPICRAPAISSRR